jgi:hypothetical protein
MSAAGIAPGLDGGMDATAIGGARVSDVRRPAQTGAGGLARARERAEEWARLGQLGAFYALAAFGALALIGGALFIIGAVVAFPFPGVRALWGLPAFLGCVGIGGGIAMVMFWLVFYTGRHLIEDAGWAFDGGGLEV